ncbi:hypothetical protein CA13_11560 [Planctomycetes bacterium CA13]|uniref:Glycosyltransferase RgtA/B/C/D-like domain-containing protein n=1 Tax=Novipirellula herctigrandis TaxID=2527986 RepID=A0A5C5YXF7_9BACT|nr:hypothetical protein CA13_11560 [Planctomycetes bacterium CA13]
MFRLTAHRLVRFLLACQVVMLSINAWSTGPGWDEWRHLPSGLYHLQYGDFHPYQVNPPLVRTVAAVPVFLLGGGMEPVRITEAPGYRSEFRVARQYMSQFGSKVFRWISIARMGVIPIALFGTWLIWKIGTHFAGVGAGLFAATLWVFSPMILTHGAAITPDVAAAVFGLWASWCFYVWYRIAAVRQSVWLGVSIAAAMLSKATWIILPPIFVAIWGIRCLRRRSPNSSRSEGLQVVGIVMVSFLLIHAAYDFRGFMQPMGRFDFISRTLGGYELGSVGNRFRNTPFSWIPSPLPENYVSGVDVQKRDFERRLPSYLMGHWRNHGWWYYYIVAWLVKEPLAFWLMLPLGVFGLIFSRKKYHRSQVKRYGFAMVILPGLLVFVFVSSQTGFSHHLRYVLPTFPAAFLLAGFFFSRSSLLIRIAFSCLLLWFSLSSMTMLPRSYAFFSKGIGGACNGHFYLDGSNLDWGQDLPTIAQWVRENPQKRPVYLLHTNPLDFQQLGIDATSAQELVDEKGPTVSGWWVVSKAQCLEKPYDWFLEQTPDKKLSVSTNVYHIDGRNDLSQELK